MGTGIYWVSVVPGIPPGPLQRHKYCLINTGNYDDDDGGGAGDHDHADIRG